MDQLGLGIEIGGTKLQIVAGTMDGVIRQRSRFAVDLARGALGIRETLAAAVPGLLKASGAKAIGVGFGGPVDWRTGEICCSHHVEGWSGFAFAAWMRSVSGLPVRIDNDANVACLGEARSGAGRGLDPLLYVTLGSGVGGGMVVGGHIYHGAIPGEVELGHVRLDRVGSTVESCCSGWAMDRRVRAAVGAEPGSILAARFGGTGGVEGGESRQLGVALQEGCPLAGRLLDAWAEDLAFGLSHAVHLLHPAGVVLGGGLSLLGEPLRSRAEARLSGFLMEAFRPGPTIRLAGLGEDAVPVGALILASEESRGARGSAGAGDRIAATT